MQLTTYLSTDEQVEEWNTVKAYFADMKDAAILRELIRGKALDIGKGATKRQTMERILEMVEGLDGRVQRIETHLGINTPVS